MHVPWLGHRVHHWLGYSLGSNNYTVGNPFCQLCLFALVVLH